jgi:hypothetical protein
MATANRLEHRIDDALYGDFAPLVRYGLAYSHRCTLSSSARLSRSPPMYGHLADPDKWVDTPECTLLDASSTFGSVSSVSILPNVANRTSLHCKSARPLDPRSLQDPLNGSTGS